MSSIIKALGQEGLSTITPFISCSSISSIFLLPPSLPHSSHPSISVSHQSLFPCSFYTLYPPSITLSLHPFSLALILFSHHRLLLPLTLPSDFQCLSLAVLFTVAEIKIHKKKYHQESTWTVCVCMCVCDCVQRRQISI